jgi:hypothetical protein
VTALDSDLIKQIAKGLKELVSQRHVRRILEIPETTWRRWKKRGEKEQRRLSRGLEGKPDERIFVAFVATLKKADSEGVRNCIRLINKAAPKHWQAAAWILERTHPTEFSLAAFEYRIRKIVEEGLERIASNLEAPGP